MAGHVLGRTLLLAYFCGNTLATQIFAGTSTLKGSKDTCQDTQEFSCVNDTCDPRTGFAYNARCRNGDNPDGTCDPGTLCNSSKAGRCIENTISSKGFHHTPTRAEGSEKHFYCVNVLEYDKPAVIYEKADCTGKSCFIPGEGHWRTWANGAQANCIDIDPGTPVSVPPCLAPGQGGKWPPTGGFPSDLALPVGGNNGLADSFADSHTCEVPPDDVWPALIETDSYKPPTGDVNQQYQSGITDNGDLDVGQLDTRALRAHLWARVEPIQAITTTAGLRNVYDQFAQHVGGLSNLRGVAARINTLKNRILLSLLPAARIPNWVGDNILTAQEARGLSEFFLNTSNQAQLSAASIGAALDVIAGSSATEAFSKAFVKWVVGQWSSAYYQMHVAAGPLGKRAIDDGLGMPTTIGEEGNMVKA
ncbi:MAG: hypothetical protein Q9198_000002 [Flavoplaca austrocitrina]